jgi:periplasmic protein TonB
MTLVSAPISHEIIGTDRLHRLGWGEVLLWATAFVFILAVQAVAAVVVANWHSKTEVPGAPPPAIMIELSEISVAPQVEDIAAEDGELALPQEPAQAAEPVPAEAVPEEVVEPLEPVTEPEPEAEPVVDTAEAVLPDPLPEPVAEPVEQVEPTPVESMTEPVAEPVATIEPEDIEPLPEPEPVDELIPDLIEAENAEVYVPMPRQMPAALEQKRREVAEAREREKAREREREAREKQARTAQAEAAASQQTAPRSVEAKPNERAAAAQQTTTTKRTPSVSPEKWQSQLNAHLNRNKRYPADARRQRQEGIPQLQFTIDASGTVLSARISRSSGIPVLDQAAIDMINRASPVPAPPASMAKSRITLTVPVNFNLK